MESAALRQKGPIMTSKEDWAFRTGAMRDAAKFLREKAHDLIAEAIRYENIARDADRLAELPDPRS